MGVEPVPNAPAAVADCEGERLLLVADYHAGIERVFRQQGIEIQSRSGKRRERLRGLLGETDPDRLVVLGDLVHSIGDPGREERAEIEALFAAIDVPVTLVKGNHDGVVEPVLAALDHDVTVTETTGIRLGPLGLVHGHTWPDPAVLGADVVCLGHEHPVVRLVDEVGGSRMERVWLRGDLDPAPFLAHAAETGQAGGEGEDATVDESEIDAEMVVFPAFNDLSGGTWVNVTGQDFLSPFLPEGLAEGEAYLLDGTRLGDYRSV